MSRLHAETTATPPARRSLLTMGVVDAGAPRRAELEAFVGSAFKRRHDATVSSFMPTLLSFRDSRDELRGVVGLRDAGRQSLYLEQYLAQPIEAAIGAATGQTIQRDEIVEVGNLAGANCRAAIRIVAMLPGYLLARDYRWITFTATRTVRGILQTFGAPLVELGRADRACVMAGPDHWGGYYEQDPWVLAGFLPSSLCIHGFDRNSNVR